MALNWISLAEHREVRRSVANAVMNIRLHEMYGVFAKLRDCYELKNYVVQWS
jgi:hypothetical protein